jgi:hypothetical protein
MDDARHGLLTEYRKHIDTLIHESLGNLRNGELDSLFCV